jgi:hypothetical protein
MKPKTRPAERNLRWHVVGVESKRTALNLTNRFALSLSKRAFDFTQHSGYASFRSGGRMFVCLCGGMKAKEKWIIDRMFYSYIVSLI